MVLSSIIILVAALVSVFSLGIFQSVVNLRDKPKAAGTYTFTSASAISESIYNNNSTFYIGTPEGFKGFVDTSQEATLVGDPKYDWNGKTIILTADIDMGGESILPIGCEDSGLNDYYLERFAGTFDGNSKTISNLVITSFNTDESYMYVGLFARLGLCTIKNLRMYECVVKNTHTYDSDVNVGLGMIAGQMSAIASSIQNCVIENCEIESTDKEDVYTSPTVGVCMDKREAFTNDDIFESNYGIDWGYGGNTHTSPGLYNILVNYFWNDIDSGSRLGPDLVRFDYAQYDNNLYVYKYTTHMLIMDGCVLGGYVEGGGFCDIENYKNDKISIYYADKNTINTWNLHQTTNYYESNYSYSTIMPYLNISFASTSGGVYDFDQDTTSAGSRFDSVYNGYIANEVTSDDDLGSKLWYRSGRFSDEEPYLLQFVKFNKYTIRTSATDGYLTLTLGDTLIYSSTTYFTLRYPTENKYNLYSEGNKLKSVGIDIEAKAKSSDKGFNQWVNTGNEWRAEFGTAIYNVTFMNIYSEGTHPALYGDDYITFSVYRGVYVSGSMPIFSSSYSQSDSYSFEIKYSEEISADNGKYSFFDASGAYYEVIYSVPYVVDHFYYNAIGQWDYTLPGDGSGYDSLIVTQDGYIKPYTYPCRLDLYAGGSYASNANDYDSVTREVWSPGQGEWVNENDFGYSITDDILLPIDLNTWVYTYIEANIDYNNKEVIYTVESYHWGFIDQYLVKYKWGNGCTLEDVGLSNWNSTYQYYYETLRFNSCYDATFIISPIISYVGGTTGEPVTATFESVGIENSVTIVPKGYYVAVTEGGYTSEYDYNYITVHTGNYIHYELEKNSDNELVSCVLYYEWEEYNEYLQMLVTCRYEYVYTIPEANIGQIEFYGLYAEGGIYSDGYIAGSGGVCPDFGQVIEITFNLSDQAYLYEFYTNSSVIPDTKLSYLDRDRDSRSYAAETTGNPIKISRNTNGTIDITREISEMNDRYYITYLTADGTYLAQYLAKSSHYRLKEDGFSSAEFGYSTVAVVDDLVIEPVFYDPQVKFEVFDTKNSEYADMSYVINTTTIAVEENHETWDYPTEKNNTALSLMWGTSYSMSSTLLYEDYNMNSVSKLNAGNITASLSQDRSTMVFEFTVNEEYYYNEGYDYDYVYNYIVTYKIKDKYVDYALFNDLFIVSSNYSIVKVVAGNSATIVPSNVNGYFELGLLICPTIEVGFDVTFDKTIGEVDTGFDLYQWNFESLNYEIIDAESEDSRLVFSHDGSVEILMHVNESVAVYTERYIDAETNTNNYIFEIEIYNNSNGDSYIYKIEYDLSNIENNSKYVLKYALNSTNENDFIELESDVWNLDGSTSVVCKVDFRSYEIGV